MATLKERFQNALFGTPTVDYGAENQAYLNELAKQQEFQNLAQRNNLTLDQALSGVMQGRNYGNKNIAQRQQELGINIPQNQEEVALADRGLLNNYTTRQGGFFNDLASGYRENATQGFNVNNLAPVQNKGLATRIGEGLGTLTRFYDKPIGRGLLAGTIGLALGGGAGGALAAGLATGVGRQQYKTADQIYRNQLKQMGMTDDELNNIKGNVTKEMFEGITSGMRYNNQRVTYGQLAPFSPEIQEAIAKNPILEYQYLPVNLARDFYSKKGEQAEGKMAKVAAETKKIEEETKQVGKPKVTINRKEGGTTSTVNITHTGGSGKGSGTPDRPTKKDYVQMQAPNGKIYNVPRSRMRVYINAGGKVVG